MFRPGQIQQLTDTQSGLQWNNQMMPAFGQPQPPPEPNPLLRNNLDQLNQHVLLGVQAVNRLRVALQVRNS